MHTFQCLILKAVAKYGHHKYVDVKLGDMTVGTGMQHGVPETALKNDTGLYELRSPSMWSVNQQATRCKSYSVPLSDDQEAGLN